MRCFWSFCNQEGVDIAPPISNLHFCGCSHQNFCFFSPIQATFTPLTQWWEPCGGGGFPIIWLLCLSWSMNTWTSNDSTVSYQSQTKEQSGWFYSFLIYTDVDGNHIQIQKCECISIKITQCYVIDELMFHNLPPNCCNQEFTGKGSVLML